MVALAPLQKVFRVDPSFKRGFKRRVSESFLEENPPLIDKLDTDYQQDCERTCVTPKIIHKIVSGIKKTPNGTGFEKRKNRLARRPYSTSLSVSPTPAYFQYHRIASPNDAWVITLNR